MTNTTLLNSAEILDAKILIVDDLESNVMLLEQLLSDEGYTEVSSVMNSLEVCELHRKNHYDLILLDLQMPEMDGFQVMEGLKENADDPYLSVIVLTAQPAHKLRALQVGAKDFISKPFDMFEVKTRIHNILEVRLLYRELEAYSRHLEARVLERTADLVESEERFRCFAELASDWYWEQDENGKFTSVSGPILEMLGLQEDALTLSRKGINKAGWNAQERKELQTKISERKPFLDFSLSKLLSNGLSQTFRISGQPIFGPDCRFAGYRGVGVEVKANQ